LGGWHAFKQEPQWLKSVLVLTHESPQMVSFDWQWRTHDPPEQVFPVGHTCPQEPQLLASLLSVAQ
jgi:hypothetical protein